MNAIAVIYLNYKPLGGGSLRRFLDSYAEYPAGLSHDLIVHEFNSGFDIHEYMRIGWTIPHDFLLCFNTETEIVADRWLAKMAAHVSNPFVGLVGAFGSLEGCPNGSPKFPNPHIRTNSFLVRKKMFLDWGYPGSSKQACYNFESGEKGMYRRVKDGGMVSILVGKDGCWGEPDQWIESHTFRLHEQENLLFQDNQSRHYQEANAEERARLVELAWGART